MSQFTIYRNHNARTKNRIPFLLDVQSDLLSDLGTRVVIPLALTTTFKGKVLCPHGENFDYETHKTHLLNRCGNRNRLLAMAPNLAGSARRTEAQHPVLPH